MHLNEWQRALLTDSFGAAVARKIADAHVAWLARHGDRAVWQALLSALPEVESGWRMIDGCLRAGGRVTDTGALAAQLEGLIPWRKGPLDLAGVAIDTEWRSDWKWARIAPQVDLAGRRVLDVGAGNGYFGWAMLDAGAESVIGCDPTQLFIAQHAAIAHFAGPAHHVLLASTLEDLHPGLSGFDTVCSFGVLYHRRSPLEHLDLLKQRLRAGGQLILETLIIPDQQDLQLDPPERYANMRNVHALPSCTRLLRWLEETGFADARCLDQTATGPDEQRSTVWMPFHSLSEALDPADSSRTREGHPAPLRAIVIAER